MSECYCYTCKKQLKSLGVARHVAMHRDRMEDCKVRMKSGQFEYDFSKRNGTKKEMISKEMNTINAAMRAIVLTMDYLGIGPLKAIKGWEWYDFAVYCLEEYPNLEWVKQFEIRKKKWEEESEIKGWFICPHCSIKIDSNNKELIAVHLKNHNGS